MAIKRSIQVHKNNWDPGRRTSAGRCLTTQIWSGVLSLMVVTRSSLPDVGAGEAQHSRHAANTVIFQEPQGAVSPSSKPALRRPFFGECWRGPSYFWSRRYPHSKKPFAILAHTWGVWQKSSTPGTVIRENRYATHFGQGQRLLTPYQHTSQSTHQTTKSPAFQPQDQNRS